MNFSYDTNSETLAVRILNIKNIPRNNKEVSPLLVINCSSSYVRLSLYQHPQCTLKDNSVRQMHKWFPAIHVLPQTYKDQTGAQGHTWSQVSCCLFHQAFTGGGIS